MLLSPKLAGDNPLAQRQASVPLRNGNFAACEMFRARGPLPAGQVVLPPVSALLGPPPPPPTASLPATLVPPPPQPGSQADLPPSDLTAANQLLHAAAAAFFANPLYKDQSGLAVAHPQQQALAPTTGSAFVPPSHLVGEPCLTFNDDKTKLKWKFDMKFDRLSDASDIEEEINVEDDEIEVSEEKRYKATKRIKLEIINNTKDNDNDEIAIKKKFAKVNDSEGLSAATTSGEEEEDDDDDDEEVKQTLAKRAKLSPTISSTTAPRPKNVFESITPTGSPNAEPSESEEGMMFHSNNSNLSSWSQHSSSSKGSTNGILWRPY